MIMKARHNRHLGNINPLPFAITFVNNLGWVIYGSMLSNYYIFSSCIFGVLFGLFYTITCLTIMAKEAVEDEFTFKYGLIEGLLLFGLFFWGILGIIQTSLFQNFPDPNSESTKLIGYLCCFFNICYYGAPLSTMLDVIKKKDASSLYLPAIFVNSLNATLWLSYGAFGVHSPVVWVPSFIGLVLSLGQVVLAFLYHKGPWFHAASGSITHDTILSKSRVEDIEADGHRKMSFVVTPGTSKAIDQDLLSTPSTSKKSINQQTQQSLRQENKKYSILLQSNN
jgi:solute carrier family 50 protein (sugar transporter)